MKVAPLLKYNHHGWCVKSWTVAAPGPGNNVHGRLTCADLQPLSDLPRGHFFQALITGGFLKTQARWGSQVKVKTSMFNTTPVHTSHFWKPKFFQRLLIVAWTPGLFSVLDVFLLSPLTLAGPSVFAFVPGLWPLDGGLVRPGGWRRSTCTHMMS